MTELKTLKDFYCIDGKYIDIRKLKQEAIKELELLMTDMKTPQDLLWEKLTGNTMEYVNKQILISYIKWKNNLTEEDLKERKG